MRWRRRYAKWAPAAAAVGWAVWRYLLPEMLAGPVAARLSAAYGAPARVAAVHVGWCGTSLRGLKLYEAGARPGDAPWAEAAEVRADIGFLGVLAGRTSPRAIALEDAAVLLRFDREGALLTRLPDGGGGGRGSDLPVIGLRRGRLTIRQDGRPNDLVVHGVTAEARSDDGRLVWEGAAVDPTWGTWAACGERDRVGGPLRATLTARRVDVTPARLRELPLVPPTLWKRVEAEGETAVECTVRAQPGVPGMSLRVALTPRLMTVRLPNIGLTVDRTRGAVVYEDGIVRLRGVEGEVAGGRLGVEGELDLRAAGSNADTRLALDATNVDVRKLPAAWKVPARLEGRVGGRADVRVTRAGDRTRVAGTGRGQLRGLPIGGRPATVALELREGPLPGSAAAGACCLVAELDESNADLGRLVEEAGIEPPFPVAGPLALRVRLVVPLDTLDDPRTFRALAAADLPRATCGGAVVEGVRARIGYEGGVLRLDECSGTVSRPPDPRPPTRGGAMLEGVRVRAACAGGMAGPNAFHATTGAGYRATATAGTFHLEGAVDLRRPTRGAAMLEEVRARTAFTVALHREDEFRGSVPRPLTVAAVGPGEVRPQALSARLALEGIPLSVLAPPGPGGTPAADGTLTATVNAWAPVARLDRAGAWNGSGGVAARWIGAGGRAMPGNVRADLELRRGLLSLNDLDGHLSGTAVTGRGGVEVVAPWRFQATLALAADLAALRRLSPSWPHDASVAGRAEMTALATGSLSPFRVEGAGDGTGTGLAVGGIPVAGFRFRWHADEARVAVRDVRAEVLGGHLSGKADIPMRAAEPARMDLHFWDIDVPTLAAAIPGNAFRPPGRVSGRAWAVLDTADSREGRSLTAGFDIRAPAATADGEVAYRAGTLAYRLDGAALGGRFHLDGRVTPGDAGTADRPPDGYLRLDELDLGRLCELLGGRATAGPFGGAASAEIRFRHHGQDRRPVGLGSVAVRRLRWGEVELAPEVKATVRLTPVGLELAEVAGAVCGGEFRGQAALGWGGTGGHIDLNLIGAEASQVLVPWPALAAQVRGPLAAHVRVAPGAEWEAVGRLALRRGRVAGVEVAELELPVEAHYSPALGRGRVEVREGTAQIALGRADGRASCRWGAGTQVEGAVRFTGIDLRHLLPPRESAERVAAGLLCGRVEIRGTDVTALDDMTGSLDCTLRQTTALAFPVMRDLVPFVEHGGSERTVFDTGECRVRLARGVVRVERLALVGPAVRLSLDGTIGLDARLGLNVAVHTGRLGASPDAPVAVRLVRLRVNGTVPRPLVSVGP